MSTPNDTRARHNVAGTAHWTAWARSLGRATADPDRANGDYLAHHFLLPYQRWLNHTPRATRWLLSRATPGGLGYFNARTRYFDEVLLREAARGIDQLVLLGAGFDSRPFRFADPLARVRVFEVDMPEVLLLREQRLLHVAKPALQRVSVPIDFERDNLASALTSRGYRSDARTMFLWEGVTYYLQLEAVESVLASMATHSAPGSSVVFDFVTRAFFEGDHTGYGAKSLAEGWRRLGNVHHSGVEDGAALVEKHGFRLREEVSPSELEQRYLQEFPGGPLKAWGPMRIAHAERL